MQSKLHRLMRVLVGALIVLPFVAHSKLAPKRFAILITSYNNAEWYKANLSSVFDQDYDNYRVIYVDDASDDGTAELVEKYIAERGQQHRCTLIKNKHRVRALANIYNAVHQCEDDEIVFNFDGDDWLAHNQVFAMINEIYQDPQVWITYGQFKNWPTEQMGYCKPLPDEVVQKQLYRQKWWAPGQLRTFYAWLFKKIHLKDLLFEGPYFQGQFFPANSDLAIYYPMMEMAGHRHKFISEVIYIRNVQTPLNDFKANKDVQVLGSALIRAKKKYPLLPLDYAYADQSKTDKQSDIIILSNHGPEAVATVIKSIENLVLNYTSIHVICNSIAEYAQHDALHKDTIKLYSRHALENIAQNLGHYVLIMNDSMMVCRCTDLSACINELERTRAYGVYLAHDKNSARSPVTGMSHPLPVLNKLQDKLYAWAFHYAMRGDWRQPFCFGAIMRTVDCLSHLVGFYQDSIKDRQEELDGVGLCYAQPKLTYWIPA